MTVEPGGLRGAVADLFPGYFALVMATGIVALGAEQLNFDFVADALWFIALVAFVVLILLSVLRVVWFPKAIASDLTHHRTGFAFLTLVAGANVLGSGAALIRAWWDFAWVLWVVGLVCWVGLLYPALIGVIVGSPKPPLGEGINGTWFLLTVATESIAVLGALLLLHRGNPSELLEFTVLAVFALGFLLYVIVMTMLFLRWTFAELQPEELEPPSWIAAGAVAITVLAGSNLLAVRGTAPRVDRVAPFVEGLVVLSWATATFWIPVMIAIGGWRHALRRVPLRYHPSYWALVFPIGMYGVATYRMAAVTDLGILAHWPQVIFGIAIATWVLAFVGLLKHLVRGPSRAAPPAPPG
jgi:tellurite resistance protein TehA-like permease